MLWHPFPKITVLSPTGASVIQCLTIEDESLWHTESSLMLLTAEPLISSYFHETNFSLSIYYIPYGIWDPDII